MIQQQLYAIVLPRPCCPAPSSAAVPVVICCSINVGYARVSSHDLWGRYSDAAKAAEILSKLQETVFDNDTFRPIVVKMVDNKAVNVPNPDCAELLRIINEHGEDVANEVRRAWEELQKYGHGLAAHTDRVPWHNKESRPLRLDEIIMLLSVACFKTEGLGDDEMVSEEEEDGDGNAASDDTVKGRFKRVVRDYGSLVEKQPMPKRSRNNQSGS